MKHPERATDGHNAWRSAEVQSKINLLRSHRDAWTRMKIARRVGLPYSQVIKDWTTEDLAFEQAWDAIEFEDSLKCCPNCGNDPDDLVGEDGRLLDDGRIQIVAGTCEYCGQTNRLHKKMDETDRDAGKFYRPRPRPPGGPFVDDI